MKKRRKEHKPLQLGRETLRSLAVRVTGGGDTDTCNLTCDDWQNNSECLSHCPNAC